MGWQLPRVQDTAHDRSLTHFRTRAINRLSPMVAVTSSPCNRFEPYAVPAVPGPTAAAGPALDQMATGARCGRLAHSNAEPMMTMPLATTMAWAPPETFTTLTR